MRTPQAVINYILERFSYQLTQKCCSYLIYLMSYGTLNNDGGHLKNTNFMISLRRKLYKIYFLIILTITYKIVLLYHIHLYGIVIDQYLLNYNLLPVTNTYFTITKV
jgi:hypothetical protein